MQDVVIVAATRTAVGSFQGSLAGIPAVDLHGNLSQPARDRNLAAFGDGRRRSSAGRWGCGHGSRGGLWGIAGAHAVDWDDGLGGRWDRDI